MGRRVIWTPDRLRWLAAMRRQGIKVKALATIASEAMETDITMRAIIMQLYVHGIRLGIKQSHTRTHGAIWEDKA